jgi:hypothetical protein
MSGRISDAGKIVYVSYSASRQDVQVEESDVAYAVALRPGRHEPDFGVKKVTFWGPAQSAQDNVHFSGFYALKTAASATSGITLHRLETFDIVSSRRFCIAGHMSVRRVLERVPPVEQTAFLPWCRRSHETRISIPSWEPKLTAENRLPSEPPTGDGKVVYVSFDAPQQHCDRDPDGLLAFSLVKTESDRAGVDGIAVNFRGNSEPFDGGCRIYGFFMNEPVFGMHQGVAETYFGAIDKDRIVSTGQYCLALSRSSDRDLLQPQKQ